MGNVNGSTDSFLVNRGGTLKQCLGQNLSSNLADNDELLVNRGGTLKKITGSRARDHIDSNDELLVSRNGTIMKVQGSDFNNFFQPTVMATASGAISNGDPVIQNSDGTVSSIAGGVTEYNPPYLDETSKNLWNDNPSAHDGADILPHSTENTGINMRVRRNSLSTYSYWRSFDTLYDETTQTIVMVLSIFEGRYDYSPESGYQRLILLTGKIEGSGTSKSTTWVDSVELQTGQYVSDSTPSRNGTTRGNIVKASTGQLYVTYLDVYGTNSQKQMIRTFSVTSSHTISSLGSEQILMDTSDGFHPHQKNYTFTETGTDWIAVTFTHNPHSGGWGACDKDRIQVWLVKGVGDTFTMVKSNYLEALYPPYDYGCTAFPNGGLGGISTIYCENINKLAIIYTEYLDDGTVYGASTTIKGVTVNFTNSSTGVLSFNTPFNIQSFTSNNQYGDLSSITPLMHMPITYDSTRNMICLSYLVYLRQSYNQHDSEYDSTCYLKTIKLNSSGNSTSVNDINLPSWVRGGSAGNGRAKRSSDSNFTHEDAWVHNMVYDKEAERLSILFVNRTNTSAGGTVFNKTHIIEKNSSTYYGWNRFISGEFTSDSSLSYSSQREYTQSNFAYADAISIPEHGAHWTIHVNITGYNAWNNLKTYILTSKIGSTNLADGTFLGFASGDYSNGSTARIQITNSVDDAQSGLSVGSQYYVQSDGSLSTSPDPIASVFAGTAITSNKIRVKS